MSDGEGRILVLPADVVNKIAAGEVIERPASVVKELVENSLDAGASRVEIALEEGGVRLIRVADDGEGMSPADVGRAFLSHATSKLRTSEDLFNVQTMGFRGEALASVGSVSEARLVSRARGALHGAEVTIRAGELGAVRDVGAPEGTSVEVRNLFFNTPVRRKFLKSPATELRHAAEAVTRLALARPDATFHLTHGRRAVLRLAAADGPLPRIRALFGADAADRLLEVDQRTPALAVTGYAGPPDMAQSSAQMQYVLLNGRCIRDRAVQRAVAEVYRGRVLSRASPVVFLYLWMDPARVDVNVHPTKIEVRFRDPGAVYALVLTALERALAGPGAPGAAAPPRPEPSLRLPSPAARPLHGPSALAPGTPASMLAGPVGRRVMQVGNTYIVEETPDGFRLIDQHALHERLLYAEFAARARDATVSRQRLLLPDVVELKPAEFLLALELRDTLDRMGLEVAEFGPNTVAVHTVPHILRDVNAGRLLQELVEELRRGTEGEAALPREERLLRIMACKGAVKAGKPLSEAEMEALLDRRDRTAPEPTCPHGRPHSLAFRFAELERQFQRR